MKTQKAPDTLGILLVLIFQILGAAYEPVAAGDRVASPTIDDSIVNTVEVMNQLREIRTHAEIDVAKYLSSLPTLVVHVEPAEPANFVVSINGTSYDAGARMFRVVEGAATIVVARPGKDPCKATLKITESGPNAIECQM
jgi:hypothetical protein